MILNWHKICLITILFIILINFVNSCYITNCPWGGKRGQIEEKIRYCHTCANGLGMCFGPKICCGPDIGCLLDTKVSHVCESEDTEFAKPCLPYGKSCTQLKYGRCATKNLCCNPESCIFDETCYEEATENSMYSDGKDEDDNQTLNENNDNNEYRNDKQVKERLKLALKHLVHSSKNKNRKKSYKNLNKNKNDNEKDYDDDNDRK